MKTVSCTSNVSAFLSSDCVRPPSVVTLVFVQFSFAWPVKPLQTLFRSVLALPSQCPHLPCSLSKFCSFTTLRWLLASSSFVWQSSVEIKCQEFASPLCKCYLPYPWRIFSPGEVQNTSQQGFWSTQKFRFNFLNSLAISYVWTARWIQCQLHLSLFWS